MDLAIILTYMDDEHCDDPELCDMFECSLHAPASSCAPHARPARTNSSKDRAACDAQSAFSSVWVCLDELDDILGEMSFRCAEGLTETCMIPQLCGPIKLSLAELIPEIAGEAKVSKSESFE